MQIKDRIVDIRENALDPYVLRVLLIDRTTGKNIIWGTDDYTSLGECYTLDFWYSIVLW